MNIHSKEVIFGRSNSSNIDTICEYIKQIDKDARVYRNMDTPFASGNYRVDVKGYLEGATLGDEPLPLEIVSRYIASFFENMPNFANPGTMINVIPPVNLFSIAAMSYFSQASANLAQDTYSGNLFLAELEVVKYISNIAKWDWKKSAGLFTFGGKGTNLYSTKIALLNADPTSYRNGVEKGRYFIVTSENGHPCHAQVCDWLGIGKDACIEIECDSHGVINIDSAEREIRKNITLGKMFLGINLNGGSTNELAIDPIKKTREMIDHIVQEFGLDYRPLLHIDSVIGWVYLLFDTYDFDKNSLKIPKKALNKIRELYNKISEIRYADSMGVDFHKTGFCPYISSLFIVRNKEHMALLNQEKEWIDIEGMQYGSYNPYNYSLECSRAVTGPIVAISALKLMGKDGFRKEISNLVDCICYLREKLKAHSKICLIEEDNNGFATLFVLCPTSHKLTQKELYSVSKEKQQEIQDFNVKFGKYILEKALNKEIPFVFTSSRSYTLPGTKIKIGALKIWMLSVFQSRECLDQIINSLFICIEDYYRIQRSSGQSAEKPIRGYFADPSLTD